MRRAAGAPGREPTRHLRTTVPTFKPPTSPNIITGITTLETVRRVVEPCIWEDVHARMFLRTGRAPVAGLKAKLCLFECRRTDPVHRCGRIAPPPRLVSVNPGMDCRSSEPARTALSPSELLYVIVAELLGGGGGRAVRAGRRCECGLWPLGAVQRGPRVAAGGPDALHALIRPNRVPQLRMYHRLGMGEAVEYLRRTLHTVRLGQLMRIAIASQPTGRRACEGIE